MLCQNCGATHSCSCQLRKASDGKECCTNCIGIYETKIRATKKDDQVLSPQQQLQLNGKFNSR